MQIKAKLGAVRQRKADFGAVNQTKVFLGVIKQTKADQGTMTQRWLISEQKYLKNQSQDGGRVEHLGSELERPRDFDLGRIMLE
jgi:hypothetical protein